MNLQALTVGAFGLTIFLVVLTEGMIVTRADVAYLFGKPVRLVRTILAMNVLGPIVAVIVCRFFALHPAVIVALVTLSMTPVGALFPQGMLALVGRARRVRARALRCDNVAVGGADTARRRGDRRTLRSGRPR